MNAKRPKFGGAVTLIEIMVAMVILTIAALGALSYQYHAAGHALIARAQIAATRTAQLLLEDWKSTGGSEEYAPNTLAVGFSSPLPIPAKWKNVNAQVLGNPLNDAVYAVTTNDLPMQVMLEFKDIAQDTTAEVKLRQLAVTVKFGAVSGTNPDIRLERIPPVILTTYVRADASGG